jgi:regulator of cell morphogenesis and NO signaling
MENLRDKTVAAFVTEDFRTAAVFSKYKIDFCCKGQKTINEVCLKQNIDTRVLLKKINEVLLAEDSNTIDFNSWPLDLLADYIEKTHHRYVVDKSVIIIQFLSKLCNVHGARHQELFKINDLFIQCVNELSQHMKKEEFILFPFIKDMVKAIDRGEAVNKPAFGSVANPIATMIHEHEVEGERFNEISNLTNNYTAPSDGCTTYKVTFAMLREFEENLHTHIHLENNILFPKAIILEKEFC